ncbi:hypothetical protein GKA01_11100 [Gluconobacter kanchanaburiensis NBRC 103587]|uniref:Uncharacterized protein n=1 Tax=Gluconobacter kanchanaburiensis NBRC 103587 TaxID=1307948 RepID=A0A511B8B4_9PROT|nr:hypothetical protein AA103587_2150 [Gluconobacter kanchanaburiensis NBRC 103587]GEK95913.1 hypothetical protein GKA01_11100 [Gluconobacter kanchanaburiensis NBRC 103587]
MTDQSNTWPACIGEYAATLAKPRDWAAAYMNYRTMMAAPMPSDAMQRLQGNMQPHGDKVTRAYQPQPGPNP